MKPVTPVLRYIPERVARPHEVVYAKNQPEYIPLPVIAHGHSVTSRWKLTFWERIQVLAVGSIFISQMNFGQPLQPILPSLDQPEPWR